MGLSFPNNLKTEASSAKLQKLSDDVSRIAATLARLAVAPEPSDSTREEVSASDRRVPSVSIEAVRHEIKARRLRAQYFDEELFADPAWDMLLDLFENELAQLRVSVSSLCVAANVPATTALRWIKTMTDADLFKRRSDPHDARRVFVELSPRASAALRHYFNALGKIRPA